MFIIRFYFHNYQYITYSLMYSLKPFCLISFSFSSFSLQFICPFHVYYFLYSFLSEIVSIFFFFLRLISPLSHFLCISLSFSLSSLSLLFFFIFYIFLTHSSTLSLYLFLSITFPNCFLSLCTCLFLHYFSSFSLFSSLS